MRYEFMLEELSTYCILMFFAKNNSCIVRVKWPVLSFIYFIVARHTCGTK